LDVHRNYEPWRHASLRASDGGILAAITGNEAEIEANAAGMPRLLAGWEARLHLAGSWKNAPNVSPATTN